MNQHEILIRKYNFLILKKHKKLIFSFKKPQKMGFGLGFGFETQNFGFCGLRFEFGSETQMKNLNPFFFGCEFMTHVAFFLIFWKLKFI